MCRVHRTDCAILLRYYQGTGCTVLTHNSALGIVRVRYLCFYIESQRHKDAMWGKEYDESIPCADAIKPPYCAQIQFFSDIIPCWGVGACFSRRFRPYLVLAIPLLCVFYPCDMHCIVTRIVS